MEQELDLHNPLTVYHDLQYDGVVSLFANESDHMTRLLSFHPSDLRSSMRRTALSLIAQAKFCYDLDPFLVYLSVSYINRFLSKQEILDKSPWIPHILVVASLSLAAKMRNSDSSLLLTVLQRDGGFEFDAQSVHRMEKIILAVLQWRMRSITPFSFLQYFLSLLNINDSSLTTSLKSRASDIIFNVQHELKLSEYKPSIIAASALLCAIQDLNPLAFSSSKTTISSCEFVNREALLKCVGVMPAITEGNEACTSVIASDTPTTPISVLGSQRTSSGSKSTSLTELNDVKRRRLNDLRENRTFHISQIKQC